MRLDHFFLGAEGVDLGRQLLLARDQLLLLGLELLHLRVEVGELSLRDGLALERRPRQVLAPLGESLPRLLLEGRDALLKLRRLRRSPAEHKKHTYLGEATCVTLVWWLTLMRPHGC